MLIHAWGGGGKEGIKKVSVKKCYKNNISLYATLWICKHSFWKCNGGYFLGANFNENKKIILENNNSRRYSLDLSEVFFVFNSLFYRYVISNYAKFQWIGTSSSLLER